MIYDIEQLLRCWLPFNNYENKSHFRSDNWLIVKGSSKKKKKTPQDRQFNVKYYYIILAYILNLYLATEIMIKEDLKTTVLPILAQ